MNPESSLKRYQACQKMPEVFIDIRVSFHNIIAVQKNLFKSLTKEILYKSKSQSFFNAVKMYESSIISDQEQHSFLY
jgi:hypothetical protein